MDLSKLPKMSQTAEAEKERARAAGGQEPPAASTGHHASYESGTRREPAYGEPIVGAEVMISAVLGLVFVALGGTFGKYLVARLSGAEFHTGVDWTAGPKAGQEVAYFELQGYTAWTDASMFVFGLALLGDALLLLAARRMPSVVWVAFTMTVLAVAMNAVTAALAFSSGIMPLFSILAVAIGVYMLAYQWRTVSAGGHGA